MFRRGLALVLAIFLISVLARPACAQVPSALLHTILSPPVGVQTGAQLGVSIAVDGPYTVVGAYFDDHSAEDGGAVKVFDSSTGALLQVLPNPSPTAFDYFGFSVAISGTLVVVGADADDTGATNAGRVYVYDLSSATPTLPVATLDNPSPATQDLFGSKVAISGTRVVVGVMWDDTGAGDAGSAYVYDLSSATPNVPSATLKNPTPRMHDLFGLSVAISGSRVVVGAYGDSIGTTYAGSVYVFELNSATPTVPIATFNNPDREAITLFGGSVAISGTRVVVGARENDTGATDAGCAYVYDLNSATPTVPVTTLNNPTPAANDAFGNSVVISGTLVVVGTYQDDTGATDAGSAYVYDLSSPTPAMPMITLNNPGPSAQDAFGISVAISGSRVVVGAYKDDTGAADAGSAYVYELSSPTPTVPTATINNPGTTAGDSFGNRVVISGTRVVVAAPLDDTGATDAGSVYVYELSSPTPTVPVVTLNNPSPVARDYFGTDVAISGTRVVVGTYRDLTGSNYGTAYVYDLNSITPTVPVAILTNPSQVSYYFANSVAISGTHVIVGRSGAGPDPGNAYVYDLTSATPTVPVMTLSKPDPPGSAGFGASVAMSGTRLVVGDVGGSSASAYVYELSSATPTVPVATLNRPDPAAVDNFASLVAISGTRVVVGAHGDDTGAFNAGRAYVYDLSSATPAVPVATLNNPSPAANDNFSYSVAISGTRVVVGAGEDDTGATNAGSAYMYDLSSATPTVPVATLNKPDLAADDVFGWNVSIDGTTVAIGAPYTDSPQADKGAVYIFGSNPNDTDNDGLLDSWEIAHFGTIVGHGAMSDFDGDGRKELLELAFGTDPTRPDTAATPVVVNEGGYLTLTLTKRAGVTYLGQSAATPMPAAFSSATTTVLIDNATTLKVRDNLPTSAGGQRFLRVQVMAAP